MNGEDTHAKGQQSVAETSNTNIQQPVQIQGIKGERAQEKSSVTCLITKLNKLIQDRGSRTLMKTLVAKIENQVKGADNCNHKLMNFCLKNTNLSRNGLWKSAKRPTKLLQENMNSSKNEKISLPLFPVQAHIQNQLCPPPRNFLPGQLKPDAKRSLHN